MNRLLQNKSYIVLQSLAVSGLVVWLAFAWQGNVGISLWDEGFLWYGTQRVLLDEVPILDFMAYDPGRYYWSATFIEIFGDNGIMSVRSAAAVFQALGLFTGLLLLATSEKRERPSLIFSVLSAAVLVMWMFPRHKLFDISVSIFLIVALANLVKEPSARRYFALGGCVGLAAVFGRNHGLYGVIASLATITWLWVKDQADLGSCVKKILSWGSGVVIGYLPVIVMILLIPGFGESFLEGVRFQLERDSTNLPLPVPWPWTVDLSSIDGDAIHSLLIGIFFLGVLLFPAFSISWVVWRTLKNRPAPSTLVASAFLSLPYAHYAFSRADVGHLALGIFPFLIGSLTMLASVAPKIRWPISVALCCSSFWVMHVFHPGWHCLSKDKCIDVVIAGETLRVRHSPAAEVSLLRELDNRFAPSGESFIAAPFWPGAYALLERKSPMWAVYALWPRDAAFQKREIDRIKASQPAFALIFDIPLDGRDELRFANTHPIIYQYIVDNFDRQPHEYGSPYQLFLPKSMK